MEDENKWKLNPEATATMKHLLEQEPEKLRTADGEVLVYRVSPKFLATTISRFDVPLPEKDDLGALKTCSLLPEEELIMVPHSIAQMFGQHVEARVFPAPRQSRWLFVGTPGIGKSFSGAHLIRSLMKKQVPVIVFETQKDLDRYLIALKDENNPSAGYDVFSVDGTQYNGDSVKQLRNPKAWYVVDCGGETSPTPRFAGCQQVCISSPDERNYKEWGKDLDNTEIIPPPTDDEVRVMVDYYISQCTQVSPSIPHEDMPAEERLEKLKEQARAVAKERITIAGPVMRRVMQHDTFAKTCNAIRLIGRNVTRREELVNLMQEINDEGDPQKLFTPDSKKNSFVFAVFPNHPCVRWTSPATEVLCKVSTLFHVATKAKGTDGGNLFEAAFKMVLLSGVEFKLPLIQLEPVPDGSTITFAEGEQSGAITLKKKKDCPACDTTEASSKAWKELPVCKSVEEDGDCFVFPCNNFPLVDFMDKQNRGYNFTLSDSHSMKFIKRSSGQASEEEINKYFVQQGWSKESPLHVVYIVPDVFSKRKAFKTTTSIPLSIAEQMKVFVAPLSATEIRDLFNRTLKKS